MFRKVNIKNDLNIDKFILMKNTREEFCEIPKEFIDSIEYNFQDYDIMKLTIPNKINIIVVLPAPFSQWHYCG